MRLLLDTSAFIWLASNPVKLSPAATAALDDSANELFLSHASVWEICLKHRVRKLRLPEAPRFWISHQMSVWQIEPSALDLETFFQTNELPCRHKDPFDRAIAAQARIYAFTVVSPDPCFSDFGLKVIW